MAKYGSIVTLVGKEKITRASIEDNAKINFTEFAAGDGGGSYYQPIELQTKLKNEKWRGAISLCRVNPESPNMIEIVAVIPPDQGGFTIREIAAFDEAGDMIVIANTPDTEKVIISSGAAGEIKLTIYMEISNAELITLKIDPNTVTATKQDLENHNIDPDAHRGRFATKTDFENHTANREIHVTRELKENYDTAIAGLTQHTENADIHVSKNQKENWTNAAVKTEGQEAELIQQKNKMTEMEGKLARLEDGVFNDITGNPYTVSFNNLDGIELIKGNYNKQRNRIEC